MRSCDVLIVGAGPAGLSVASNLSDEISCIIIHQDAEIGKPVRTSGGSFLSDMHRLYIPEKYYQQIDKLDFYSDNAEALFDIEKDKMVVLDITGLYQYLASLSDKKNRRLLLATKFITTPDNLMVAISLSSGRAIKVKRASNQNTLSTHLAGKAVFLWPWILAANPNVWGSARNTNSRKMTTR